MIIKFDKYNESLRDKMTPKPNEETKKLMSEMTLYQKIIFIVNNKGSGALLNKGDLIKEFKNSDEGTRRKIISYAHSQGLLGISYRPIQRAKNNVLDVFFEILLNRPWIHLNESIRTKMTPKSDDEVRSSLIERYRINPDIFDFLNDNGYKFVMAHETAYRDRWRITIEFRNEELKHSVYFIPGETLDVIKKRIK